MQKERREEVEEEGQREEQDAGKGANEEGQEKIIS